jgi:hypothetical protein
LVFRDRDHVLHSQQSALEVYGEYSVPLPFGKFHYAFDMGEAAVGAVSLTDDLDRFVRRVLVHIGA